nr:MAG TPA: hypothetical protein [Caudoviricetes sp.]
MCDSFTSVSQGLIQHSFNVMSLFWTYKKDSLSTAF